MTATEEDFSLVLPSATTEALSKITDDIDSYKKQHEQLLGDQKALAASIQDQREVTVKYREQLDRLEKSVKEDMCMKDQRLDEEREKLAPLKEEETCLMEELREVEAALMLEEQQTRFLLTQNNSVSAAFPERKLVFSGTTGNPTDCQRFDVKSQIEYPMEGGTALITFEDAEVASNIVVMKHHRVALTPEIGVTVEAHPLPLMLPSVVEVDTEVCCRRILISDLPNMDTEKMLNKLEIHFSKSKHGGGEVEECEHLPDSGTVVISFIREDVARGLIRTEYHEVLLSNKKYRVRVTPFLNGNITLFKPQLTPCPRTVLLRNIPPVMDAETLQDLLEIFFQKMSNGGGEIQAFLYNPEGHNALALFGEASENTVVK